VQRARFANRLFWPTRTYQVCTFGHSRSRAPELAEKLSTPGRAESSNYVRVCMQPLAFAVCSWAAAWRAMSYRLQSAVRVDSQASACLFTNRLASSAGVRGALVPPPRWLCRDPPFAVSGPICSPRDGQMKQSHLHSCPFCMRQRPAELSANRERDRQYDDSISSPHYG
jgi:hypothetical protein